MRLKRRNCMRNSSQHLNRNQLSPNGRLAMLFTPLSDDTPTLCPLLYAEHLIPIGWLQQPQVHQIDTGDYARLSDDRFKRSPQPGGQLGGEGSVCDRGSEHTRESKSQQRPVPIIFCPGKIRSIFSAPCRYGRWVKVAPPNVLWAKNAEGGLYLSPQGLAKPHFDF